MFLKPGHISEAWPAVFDPVYGGQIGDDAEVREVTTALRKERRFEIIGYHAAACELLAEWIEEELDRLERTKIASSGIQEHPVKDLLLPAAVLAPMNVGGTSPRSPVVEAPRQQTSDSEREMAWSLVRAAKRDPRKLFFIHYSSAIPADFPQEPTPINAVAVREAHSGATRLFDSSDESEGSALAELARFFM